MEITGLLILGSDLLIYDWWKMEKSSLPTTTSSFSRPTFLREPGPDLPVPGSRLLWMEHFFFIADSSSFIIIRHVERLEKKRVLCPAGEKFESLGERKQRCDTPTRPQLLLVVSQHFTFSYRGGFLLFHSLPVEMSNFDLRPRRWLLQTRSQVEIFTNYKS